MFIELRVGAKREIDPAWSDQCRAALRRGLTPGEIARIAFGPTAFAGRESAILWAGDHELANRPVDRATRCALGDATVTAVTVTARFYDAVAPATASGAEPVPALATPAQAARAALGE